MLTYRNTISSFLVAAMSMYACLLLLDVPALAQQAATFNKSSKSADLAQEGQQTPQADAQSKPDRTINRRSLKDLLRRVFELQQRGEVNLDGNLEILIEGEVDSQGLIQNAEVTQKSGDAALRPIAEEFVTALNQSGALDFLNEAKRLRLEIASSEINVAVNTSFEAESASQARSKAAAYNTLLYAGSFAKKGRAEELIYKSVRVSSKDSEVNFKFSMPRETFCALLSKYLSSH